uniref:Ras-associating domain-containing protein n=1 Tax=Strigamia maritima TaxID=126957 RepID=T1JB27_STRMM
MASEFEDSTYSSSTSEAEPDSDREDLDFDPQSLLGTWLGELESLKLGLDNVGGGPRPLSTPERLCFSSPRIDSYRFSMANLEDSQDVELDAILGELCALEKELTVKKGHQRSASLVSQGSGGGSGSSYIPSHTRSGSGGANRIKLDLGILPGESDSDDALRLHRTEMGLRTDSPDNDSAFSDNVSMLSSESSASSGTGVTRTDISTSHRIISKISNGSVMTPPTQAEQAARIKAEKIKIALEKMREASVKKLFIKAYTADGSAKSLLIDEKMTSGYVAKLLADKNHIKMDPKWTVIEQIPDLYLERIYEDHEHVVENLLMWTRDSKNKLHFVERPEKYNLFVNPEDYLLIGSSSEKGVDLDDEAKNTLVEEFFSGSGVLVPELEGILYLKSEGKKAWKKHFFVLRASGLYYCPKGKSKSSRDLLCLTTFDANHIYLGVGWKKKYKAPTDYCFAIKHPQIQTKSSKYMKFLCAEDNESLKQWVMGMRIAKFGRQLLENYRHLLQDLAEDDLEVLAHARSCSMVTMPRSSSQCTSPITPLRSLMNELSGLDLPSEPSTPLATLERSWGRRAISRQNSVRSSSSSSGFASNNGCTTPTAEQTGFEADFPMGTIKRKPSMAPKLPLTSTTRSLAKQSMNEDSLASALTLELNSKLSIGRSSLRRSLTDDRISVSGLKRKQSLSEVKSSSLDRNHNKNADIIDSLPLPPPPVDMGTSMEGNSEALPPPPPEAYHNTNVNSVPPLPITSTDRKSSFALSSPSPLLDNPVHKHNPNLSLPPEMLSRNRGSESMDLKSPGGPTVPPKPGQHRSQSQRKLSESDIGPNMPPPFLAELKAQTMSPGLLRRPSPHRKLSLEPYSVGNRCATLGSSSCKTPDKFKKFCFDDDLTTGHQLALPPPPPPLPSPPSVGTKSILKNRKPPPPKRSAETKLSIANGETGGSSQVAPPREFLKDLHRVMEKKWKLAQQLSQDTAAYPVMGFRDLSDDHQSGIGDRNYENLLPLPPPPPPMPSLCLGHRGLRDNSVTNTPKRKPPPPPPKRNENTQLSKGQ